MNELPATAERIFKFTIILGVLAAIIRLILLGAPELLPEEAYYWNYAAHLAPGYLDHPPLSAWLIALGTWIFGLNEFGVRFGAYLSSFVTAYFVFKTTELLIGRKRAWLAVAILSALPYTMGNSFYISPDAPLAAAWAAAIYLLVRIIQIDPANDKAWGLWLGLGAAFGCGLLSKYTISLLPISAGITFLLQPKLRRWFIRPQPYVAVLIAIALFSPVIYWNATHEWASVVFQGSRRFAEAPRFSLHDFIGHFLLIGTPVGCVVALLFCFGKIKARDGVGTDPARQFLLLSFAVPIAIFTVYSVRHLPRLNWTGPPFLGMIPLFTQHVLSEIGTEIKCAKLWQRSWKLFLTISLIGFSFLWLYGGPGIPFLGYSPRMARMIGWEDLGAKVLALVQEESRASGGKPFVLGMDKHYSAAELSFYLRRAANETHVESPPIAGRAIVGISSLMFRYWVPDEVLIGRSAILVTRNRGDLEFPEVSQAFAELGPIVEYRATRNGKPAGVYQYRIARGFRGADMINHIREP